MAAAVIAISACMSCRSSDSPLFDAKMPRLGIGLAALGRPGYINLGRADEFSELGEARTKEAMQERCHRVLDVARDLGLKYFDAARSYGEAEAFLGAWLTSREIKPGELVVGSKWGYRYNADWKVETGGEPHEIKDHSVSHLRSQTLETEERLGSHLCLYQIHSATLESGVLDNAEVLAELARLKLERGWKIGLSVSGPQQAVVIRKACALEPRLFDCVQATYNLMEQASQEALEEASRQGMEVIIKEAMANGRLLAKGRSPAADAVLKLAGELDVPPDALCLAAVMRQPFAPMVLSGAATEEQLRSNVRALEIAEDGGMLTDKALTALMQACLANSEEYWAERSALQWN
mmetsp:Transcript_19278/g.61055  ORF Transcript_19278/g.61055 Transcript_19278/m.61055 type:complete len:350 (-) Transcript_19278:610-1659(-)